MWVKGCLWIVLCLAWSGQCVAADLEEAKVQLQQWRQKIVSIRVRWSRDSVAESNASLAASGIQSSRGEFDWIWEDSGRFRDESVAYNDGRIIMREMRLADLKHCYVLGYQAHHIESEIPAQVSILENSIRNTGIRLLPPLLRGLWNDYSRTWLADRLAGVTAATVSDEGWLQISGEEADDSTYPIFLDPDHGYLPKMVGKSGGTRFVVDEFREIEPGFWFPWKGMSLLNIDLGPVVHHWEVKQVDLNTELPDSLFVPPMGDETYVVNTLTGKQYWHAGKPPAHLLAEKAAAAAAQSGPAPVHNSQPLTGEPESAGNWSLWLALLGVVLVGVGVWVRRRA